MAIITKIINFTKSNLDSFEQEEGFLMSLSNAHYFSANFLKQSVEIRKTQNIHNLTYNEMYEHFGEASFFDEYTRDHFWILKYGDNQYTIAVNSNDEGSTVSQFILGAKKDLVYNEKFSQDAKEFSDQLMKQIK